MKMIGVVDEGVDGFGICYFGGLFCICWEFGWCFIFGCCCFCFWLWFGFGVVGFGDGFVFCCFGFVDGFCWFVCGFVCIVCGEDIGSGVFEKGFMDEWWDVCVGFFVI